MVCSFNQYRGNWETAWSRGSITRGKRPGASFIKLSIDSVKHCILTNLRVYLRTAQPWCPVSQAPAASLVSSLMLRCSHREIITTVDNLATEVHEIKNVLSEMCTVLKELKGILFV